jgi:hypothetical protein
VIKVFVLQRSNYVIGELFIAELMTHRVFSRNAGSSRARPSKAIIEQVANDPWGPIVWGLNEPGMQANNVADA